MHDVIIEARTTVGLSQITWLGTLRDGAELRPIVLRLPTAASGGRSILAQRLALQVVAGHHLPVPELLWHDDGHDNLFGCPFIVMARAPGSVPVGWEALDTDVRHCLAEQAIDALAGLHAIDVDQTPLAHSEPSSLMDYRGLERLARRLSPLPPVMDAALWWLARHQPKMQPRRAIVHGDYRMGNMVVDEGRITGILDWEMAAPGDPLADLVWCFIPVWEPPGVDEAPLLKRYAERTGIDIDSDALHWHRVLAFLRLSYYALSATRAFDSGKVPDLRLAALRLHLPIRLDRLAAAMAGEPLC
nr:phosphotransferase family protein [Chelatococcus sp. HY11]